MSRFLISQRNEHTLASCFSFFVIFVGYNKLQFGLRSRCLYSHLGISVKSILESSYDTPRIFGVELAMYANFWRISKGVCLTGVAWRGVNLKHCKII